jgi:hypothetical protein
MTKAEAADLLGVQEHAPLDRIRRRFEELHNDFNIRLTNAPTAALRKTYQQNLQDLRAAVELLAPGAAAQMVDLPAAEPAGAGAMPNAGRSIPTRPTPAAAAEPAPPPALGRTAVLAIAAAAVFAALSAYLIITQQTLRQTSAKTQASLEVSLQELKRVEKAYVAWEFADTLRVKNGSRHDLHITVVSLTYRDATTGELKTVHSGSYTYPDWTIRSGSSVTLDDKIGRGRDWNGAVVFYSCVVEYPGVEAFLKSGLWKLDAGTEKQISISLD